jgi:hypothetical protein
VGEGGREGGEKNGAWMMEKKKTFIFFPSYIEKVSTFSVNVSCPCIQCEEFA